MNDIWNWKLLRAGSFRLDGGAMYGIIPKNLWRNRTPCDEQNRITLQTNCLLLDNGSRTVLIETGYGNKFDAKQRAIFAMESRSILDALSEINVDPCDVTDVILTHLHFDHAGGLTRKPDHSGDTPIPNFPNAVVHIQRREWEDALANRSTMTRTYLRDHLDPVAESVALLDHETQPVPGIRVMPVPGHTWGQQAVIFSDDAGTLIFPGDVMPTANHAGLAFNMAYDVEPYTNMLTKSRLLARCVDEGWRWVIDHEPGNPVVRIVGDENRFGSYCLEAV